MTKEELEKEVEEKGIKYADSLKRTISKFSDEEGYCWLQVEEAYEKGALDFAEPREKRIAKLEKQIEKMKKYLDCDYCEYQNNKDVCHQCNFMTKIKWTLKKEIKEND